MFWFCINAFRNISVKLLSIKCFKCVFFPTVVILFKWLIDSCMFLFIMENQKRTCQKVFVATESGNHYISAIIQTLPLLRMICLCFGLKFNIYNLIFYKIYSPRKLKSNLNLMQELLLIKLELTFWKKSSILCSGGNLIFQIMTYLEFFTT